MSKQKALLTCASCQFRTGDRCHYFDRPVKPDNKCTHHSMNHTRDVKWKPISEDTMAEIINEQVRLNKEEWAVIY